MSFLAVKNGAKFSVTKIMPLFLGGGWGGGKLTKVCHQKIWMELVPSQSLGKEEHVQGITGRERSVC